MTWLDLAAFGGLPDGDVTDLVVEADGSIASPLHQGRFGIHSGRALCAPLERGPTAHAVCLDRGHVFVHVTPAGAA